MQKKRSRGQPIINNSSIAPTGSSSQIGQMTVSSSVQYNETTSINVESTSTSQNDENDDFSIMDESSLHNDINSHSFSLI